MASPTQIVYTAHATATGGRDGRAVSDDGKLDVALARPKEMGGNGAGTNPEQLFAAGYAACFGGAVCSVRLREYAAPPAVSASAALTATPACHQRRFEVGVTRAAPSR